MPAYDIASRSIEQFFEANFVIPAPLQVGFLSADLIRYEDTVWRPEPSANDATLNEWVELFIMHGAGQNISVGNPSIGGGLLTRYAGVVKGHIYVKKNTGTRRKMLLANTFAAVFQNQSDSGITYREPTIANSDSPNAGYRRAIVQVFFQRDEKT